MEFTTDELNMLYQACLDTSNSLESYLFENTNLSSATVDAYFKRIRDLRKLAERISKQFKAAIESG